MFKTKNKLPEATRVFLAHGTSPRPEAMVSAVEFQDDRTKTLHA
jgi:hypothetical protein